MKSFFEFDEVLHQLLLAADKQSNLYGPLDLDLEELRKRILNAKLCLEQNISLQLNLYETEDAAFIFILQTPPEKLGASVFHENTDFSAVFSNFSNLVSIGPILPNQSNTRPFFDEVSKCLANHSFITIRDQAVFNEKYDGEISTFSNATWGDRFFNYM